jgi:hypothetical protein
MYRMSTIGMLPGTLSSCTGHGFESEARTIVKRNLRRFQLEIACVHSWI